MDLTGRVVYSAVVEVTAGANEIELTMPAVAAGTYLLVIQGQTIKMRIEE